MRRLLPKSVYAHNVITLITGAGLAQAIPIAISPLLTRLYTPEDFGILALFVSIATIVSTFITGRYELAIMLPKSDRDAFHIFALSAALSFLVSVLIFILIALFADWFAALLRAPELANWLYWIPISTMLTGIYTTFNYWSNRKAYYRSLASSRIIQAGSSSVPQLVGGYAKIGSAGLVMGQLVGQLIATSFLALLVYQKDGQYLKNICWLRTLVLARKYKNFPKYLILAHSLNTASGQMPTILLGSIFNVAAAGYYMLTQRVMGVPTALLAGALGDVFRQEASKAYSISGACSEIYAITFKRLLLIGAPSFLIFFLVAPELFSLAFGEDWAVAGGYARILTPMYFLQFVTSPLSSMFMIAQKQRADLIWQVFLYLGITSAIFVGFIFDNVSLFLVLYSATYTLMYGVNGVLSYKYSKGEFKK